jgi:GT2 family glycosyltransferase
MDQCEEDLGQYDRAEPCFWASGAALMVKAGAYREAGGLDPWFFAHQEEIDLCWRLKMAGYKIFVQPASVVFHVGGGTLPPGPGKIFLNFRNNLVMLAKNLPPGELLWKLPLRFGLNGLAALHFLAGGRIGYFWAVIRSFGAFFGWLFKGRRQSVFPRKRKALSGPGCYPGSLLWEYYARGRRTFSQIVGRN